MPAIRISAAALAPANTGRLTRHIRLTAPDGTTVDSGARADRLYGLFFGFGRCPDLGPTARAGGVRPRAEAPAR